MTNEQIIPLTVLAALLGSLALPSKLWIRLWEGAEQALRRYRQYREKIALRYSLIKRVEKLLSTLYTLERQSTPDKKVRSHLPSYKFYTDLILEIEHYRQHFGFAARPIYQELRKAITSDRQFEVRLSKEWKSGLAQFVLISLVTWSFIYLSGQVVPVHSSGPILIIIFLLQSGGTLSFIFLFYWSKRRFFRNFARYFLALYSLLALAQVGVSQMVCLKKAGIGKLFGQGSRPALFKRIDEELLALLERWQRQGGEILSPMREIIEELWFLQEERFKSFLVFATVLKFSVLAIFFLSSYLLYLFWLFNFFLG